MALSFDEAIAALGRVDQEFLARIAATGASAAELVQARAWLAAEEALIGEGRALPTGRVAELIDLLTPEDEDDSGHDRAGPLVDRTGLQMQTGHPAPLTTGMETR
jgi:hypothetical protein